MFLGSLHFVITGPSIKRPLIRAAQNKKDIKTTDSVGFRTHDLAIMWPELYRFAKREGMNLNKFFLSNYDSKDVKNQCMHSGQVEQLRIRIF